MGVTNQPPQELSLQSAVVAYREEYLIERGFGRFKGFPLSLTPIYLQRDDYVKGLIRLHKTQEEIGEPDELGFSVLEKSPVLNRLEYDNRPNSDRQRVLFQMLVIVDIIRNRHIKISTDETG